MLVFKQLSAFLKRTVRLPIAKFVTKEGGVAAVQGKGGEKQCKIN
jgi:hypothetical protein